MNYKLFEFPIHGDHTGNLVALEKEIDFSFDIKRIYYIWGTDKDAVRGRHAHKTLEQMIICVSGSCDFMLDDGIESKTIHMNSPSQGLYIKHCVWRTFTNFTENCVIMVLASEHYDENEYIHNYENFLATRNNHKKTIL